MAKVSNEWQLVNIRTGETRDLATFEVEGKSERWEKVYAKSLADLLEIGGDEKTRVIAYMVRVKDYQNRVAETIRSIADATGVSKNTVNKVVQILQDNNYLVKVRNGLWRFSPHVMVNGNATVGAAVIRYWNYDRGDE